MKYYRIILTIIMVLAIALSTIGCAEAPTITDENAEPSLPPEIVEENPLFIHVGKTITIDGHTVSASTLYETAEGKAWTTYHGHFEVNRLNGHVYFVTQTSYNHKATDGRMDTGLIFEGTLTIAGVEFNIPELTTNN
jgi:hypothetical protein